MRIIKKSENMDGVIALGVSFIVLFVGYCISHYFDKRTDKGGSMNTDDVKDAPNPRYETFPRASKPSIWCCWGRAAFPSDPSSKALLEQRRDERVEAEYRFHFDKLKNLLATLPVFIELLPESRAELSDYFHGGVYASKKHTEYQVEAKYIFDAREQLTSAEFSNQCVRLRNQLIRDLPQAAVEWVAFERSKLTRRLDIFSKSIEESQTELKKKGPNTFCFDYLYSQFTLLNEAHRQYQEYQRALIKRADELSSMLSLYLAWLLPEEPEANRGLPRRYQFDEKLPKREEADNTMWPIDYDFIYDPIEQPSAIWSRLMAHPAVLDLKLHHDVCYDWVNQLHPHHVVDTTGKQRVISAKMHYFHGVSESWISLLSFLECWKNLFKIKLEEHLSSLQYRPPISLHLTPQQQADLEADPTPQAFLDSVESTLKEEGTLRHLLSMWEKTLTADQRKRLRGERQSIQKERNSRHTFFSRKKSDGEDVKLAGCQY